MSLKIKKSYDLLKCLVLMMRKVHTSSTFDMRRGLMYSNPSNSVWSMRARIPLCDGVSV